MSRRVLSFRVIIRQEIGIGIGLRPDFVEGVRDLDGHVIEEGVQETHLYLRMRQRDE